VPIRDPPPRLLEPSSLDQLFAAPLKTFVAERKRLADQLEASGKSQAAKELGKTPRPSVSAWIVNQLARQDGPLLRELAALTDRLRDAQVQTAGAKLDGSASELLTAHRAAIKRLRGRAEEILRASNVGAPITMNAGASTAAKAYRDAARRLAGEPVPLILPSEKRPFFSRLFGRRAA